MSNIRKESFIKFVVSAAILIIGLVAIWFGRSDWNSTSDRNLVSESRQGNSSSANSSSFLPPLFMHGKRNNGSPAAGRQEGVLSSGSRQKGGRFRRNRAERNDYAQWEIPSEWQTDVFTFVRVKFDSYGYARPGRMWDNDYPDCDWNFSVRLHELTSLSVDPNGKVLEISDPALFDHPFLFMSNANQIRLTDMEAQTLRRYLLNGGFVMVDDFWAPRAFEHITEEFSKVFPDRRPRELPSDHPIFSLVYKLKGVPQVPSVHAWRRGDLFEYWHGDPEGDEDPHFWGYFDDDERLVALLCHNNDIGDGWEREGENEEYFHQYSERVSYPLGINIVVYALTH